MKTIETANRKALFEPLISCRTVQAATMTLKPGQSSSDKKNEHPSAEQWLLVTSGQGIAHVGRRAVRIRGGTLMLIEKGEPHQITNTGRRLLSTVNFYAPPAYTSEGNVTGRAAGR